MRFQLIFLSVFLLTTTALIGQSNCPECEKIKVIGVYDFGPPPGGNWVITLLTLTEDLSSGLDPHYSSLYFVSTAGDTITVPTGPSLSLPELATDTIPYLLELNTELSNQDFPEDFNGVLVIRTPTTGSCPTVTWCHIPFGSGSSAVGPGTPPKSTLIYPNPMQDKLYLPEGQAFQTVNVYTPTGSLVKSVSPYVSGEAIDLTQAPAGILWVQLIFKSGLVETHPISKVR
jgi:hypothetical protein